MSVALVVISDGRWEYLARCLTSLRAHVRYPFMYQRLVDDSGWHAPEVPGFDDVVKHDGRRGLAAAVRSAWADLPDGVDYVLHVEEDFVFVDDVHVEAMVAVLKAEPDLAQLVLKRQAWSPPEVAAGGIMESAPDLYEDRDGWVEHRRIFSLNPCLIPRPVVDLGWPVSNEAGMTDMLVAGGWSFGFWGQKQDPPKVVHIGVHRSEGWMV